MNKIKLYLLKRLYIWWTSHGDGRKLRGTTHDEAVLDLLAPYKN